MSLSSFKTAIKKVMPERALLVLRALRRRNAQPSPLAEIMGRSELLGSAASSAVAHWREQRQGDAKRLLHSTFRKCHARFDLDRLPYWNAILDAATNMHRDPEVEMRAVAALDTCPAEMHEVREWLLIYHFLIVLGMYRAGTAVRQKAAQRSAQSARHRKSTEVSRAQAYAAAVEENDLETARSFANTFIQPYVFKDPKNPFPADEFIDFLEGSRALAFIERASLTPEEIEFRSLVEGKSVAIVGPAPREGQPPLNLDEFEVVVDFNYRTPHQATAASQQIDRRIHISYYNTITGNYLETRNETEVPDTLDFAVFKKAEHLGIAQSRNIRARQSYYFPWLFYGGFNAVPHAAFDLLLFRPRRIKIHNVTLMLKRGNSTHAAGYYPAEFNRRDNSALLKGFELHDPLLQFKLLRLLLLRAKIEADTDLRTILKMSEDEFMGHLQCDHGRAAFQ